MPHFSRRSQNRLRTCHPKLQLIFDEVILYRDCTIVEGHRGQLRQDRAFDEGRSQLRWPDGNHNDFPSRAIDVGPWIDGHIPWDDRLAFVRFAGFVEAIAARLGIRIRWGGDWDGDRDQHDQTFNDLVHFELAEEEA